MPIFKVKVDTYWIVEAKNEHCAIDQVADIELVNFAADYDSFDVEQLTPPLSKDASELLIKAK